MLDFDQVINRRGTDCWKWDGVDREEGSTDLLHMGCADMDFKAPPEILQALHEVVEHGVFGYATLSPEFKKGIADWYQKRHHTEVDPEWVVFSPRIVISASCCVEAVTRPGDKVILNAPFYPPLDEVTRTNGRLAVEPPLVIKNGRYEIDFEELEQITDSSTRMMIFVSPHNPTTRVWTPEELNQVAAFCLKHNLTLLVDEIHSDFIRQGVKFTSVLELQGDIRKHLIVMSSAAKSFNIMGCAISYLIIPDERLRHTIEQELTRAAETDTNVFGNAVMKVAYQKCGYYVDEVNKYLDANEDFLRAELPKVLPGIKIMPREGSYLLWLDFNGVFATEEETTAFLKDKARVYLLPGTHFGRQFSNFARLNFACPRATLEELLNRLRQAQAQ